MYQICKMWYLLEICPGTALRCNRIYIEIKNGMKPHQI